MAGASGNMVAEIIVTLTSNGDLDASNTGSELLKALSTSATAAATKITANSEKTVTFWPTKMVMHICMNSVQQTQIFVLKT